MTTLNLTSPYIVGEPKTISTVTILQVTEDLEGKTVAALLKSVDSENQTHNFWITVWDESDYDINWTQEGLESKVVEVLSSTATQSE